MEMGNISKRQKPDQRADNSRKTTMSLQRSVKILNPELVLNWVLNKMCTSSVKMDVILNSKTYKSTKIKKHTRLTEARGS